uniref:Reverse transcriptase domain-containing protein n=1 Tax=Peronospora matthiolae TaxID=2874970 RepID=A0AAV1V1D5_9STRA
MTRPRSAKQKSAHEERFASQSWEALRESGNPVYEIAREYADVFPDKITPKLPADRGVRHEIDLVPGSKYCVTRQWPLPRDQVEATDAFFEGHRKAGHVRESVSLHSSPTFCVKKATGGWRIVYAFNKPNDATITVQTPIPTRDMVLNPKSGSAISSAIDLTDGFYQILMRQSDIPLTAVSTTSGVLWEWLVMPQGLKNLPATFIRMVSRVFRPLRDFAPSYFDDILVHSRAEGTFSAVQVYLQHLQQVFQVMRDNKLCANLKKCVFCAPEIPVLDCYVSKFGVRADPEKVSSNRSWPTPKNPTKFRQWLGLANYLHKYTKDYAVKKSLAVALVLILPDDTKPFYVVRDASDFAIGYALMPFDHEGRERVVGYQSRQMKPTEKNYPVHDKEL